jgi:putative endonuclease
VSYWTYILCNKPYGTLYIGMTNHIIARTYQHREGLIEGFTKRYGITRLVYLEEYATPGDAIVREKTLKRWPRAWHSSNVRTRIGTISTTGSRAGPNFGRACVG